MRSPHVVLLLLTLFPACRGKAGSSTSSAAIGPAGGTLEAGGARLLIPPDAVSTAATFSLREVAAKTFEIGTERGLLKKPCTITLPVELPAGADPARVHVVLSLAGVSERMRGAVVDSKTSTVTLQTDRLFPLANAHSCAPARPPEGFPVVVAGVDPADRIVLPTEDGVQYVYLKSAEETTNRLLPGVKAAVAKARSGFQAMKFVLPSEIQVGFRPTTDREAASAWGGDSIHINTAAASLLDPVFLEGAITHEMAHLVQQQKKIANLRAGKVEVNMENLHPEVGRWFDEGTAEFLATRLSPAYSDWVVKRLKRDFAWLPLRRWNQPDDHEYQTGVFFCWLDTLYDGVELFRSVAAIYMSGQRIEVDSLTDRKASRGSWDPLNVLDHVLRSTPDRHGTKRSLGEAYLHFLPRLLWKKDFEPVAGNAKALEPELGPVAQIVLPDPPKRIAWDLPDGTGPERVARKSQVVAGDSWQIVNVVQITSKAEAAKNEAGDLTISIAAPSGMPKGSASLLVFPTRKVLQEPMLGEPGKPVVIPDWEQCQSATVWVVDTSHYGNWDLEVTAEMKAPAKKLDASGDDFELVLQKAGTTGHELATAWVEFRLKDKKQYSPDELAESLSGAGANRSETHWMRLELVIGDVKSIVYGQLEIHAVNRVGGFGGEVRVPLRPGTYPLVASVQLFGKRLQLKDQLVVVRDPAKLEQARAKLAESTKSLAQHQKDLADVKAKRKVMDEVWLEEHITRELCTIAESQLVLGELVAAQDAATEAMQHAEPRLRMVCNLTLAKISQIEGDPAKARELVKDIPRQGAPLGQLGFWELAVRDRDDLATAWKWLEEDESKAGGKLAARFPKVTEPILR